VPIQTITFNGNWLDNQQAHLVIAQPPPLPPDLLHGDGQRVTVLKMLGELLAGPTRLAQIVTQSRPAILVLPEVAVASADWNTLDALVRAYPSPLILIAGFSITRGPALRDWLAQAPSATTRRATWCPETEPANDRVYNGGWCWVHDAEGTSCICFLKLTAEQREEITIPGLDQGRETLCVELGDLLLIPTICSDFLATAAGVRAITERIGACLANRHNDARKVLIIGLLAQRTAHPEWRRAITDVVRANTDKINVCLVNWAYDILLAEEDHDRWRDFSGLYMASERRPGSTTFLPVRRLTTEALEGSVARVTGACVLGGPVRWSFTGTARNIWTVNLGYLIQADGSLQAPCCEDHLQYELIRLLRRFVEGSDVAAGTKTPATVDGLGRLKTHVSDRTMPNADVILHSILFGEKARNPQLNIDLTRAIMPALEQGLKALGALTLVDTTTWQRDLNVRGQLKSSDGRHAIVVWSSPEASVRVKQTIDGWRNDPLTTMPLLVFRKSLGAAIQIAPSTPRRGDISRAPSPARRSAAEPANKNLVLEIDLDSVSECLRHASTQQSALALTNVVIAAIAQLATQRPQQ
jgi:hypothetical protein